MTKIAFKSSKEGLSQLPEILKRFQTTLLNSQKDFDVDISISITKTASKQSKRILSDSSTFSSTTSSNDPELLKRKNKRTNETTQTPRTSSMLQQTSGGYVDLAKLRDSQNYEKISKSLISNRTHRK
uniref:DEP domain-containing protein n=1 Tax=Strongyloides stercoralis TaxID=6248 RepID=A0A0K0EKJ4_STRER